MTRTWKEERLTFAMIIYWNSRAVHSLALMSVENYCCFRSFRPLLTDTKLHCWFFVNRLITSKPEKQKTTCSSYMQIVMLCVCVGKLLKRRAKTSAFRWNYDSINVVSNYDTYTNACNLMTYSVMLIFFHFFGRKNYCVNMSGDERSSDAGTRSNVYVLKKLC